MHFSFFKTRNAFCLAFCVALFSTWPRASKAQDVNANLQTIISQQQDSLDKLDNLEAWLEYFFTADSLYEYLDQALADISAYAYADFWMNNNAPLKLLYSSTTNIDSKIYSGHLNPEAIQVENEDILHEVEYVLDFLGMFYSVVSNDAFRVQFTTNCLDVADEVTHVKLDNIIGLVDEILSQGEYDLELWLSLVEGNQSIVNHLDTIEGSLLLSQDSLSDVKYFLEDIVLYIYDLYSADQSADSTFNSAYNTAESDQESQDESAASDYELIPFPEVSDDGYEPDISYMPEEPEGLYDLGLGDQQVDSHNALIRLYTPPHRRDSNPDDPPPMPVVEIDWGRDQVLQAQVSKFETFFAWFYPVLGVGFLSAKALTMFRKCKLASEARALNPYEPPNPYITLAWDPF